VASTGSLCLHLPDDCPSTGSLQGQNDDRNRDRRRIAKIAYVQKLFSNQSFAQ